MSFFFLFLYVKMTVLNPIISDTIEPSLISLSQVNCQANKWKWKKEGRLINLSPINNYFFLMELFRNKNEVKSSCENLSRLFEFVELDANLGETGLLVRKFYDNLMMIFKRSKTSKVELERKGQTLHHENTIMREAYSLFFSYFLSSNYFFINSPIRSLPIGPRTVSSHADFEIIDETKVILTIELKDFKNDKAKNIEAQLAASFIAIVNNTITSNVSSLNMNGLTIVDYWFTFYQCTITTQYIDDLKKGIVPRSCLRIYKVILCNEDGRENNGEENILGTYSFLNKVDRILILNYLFRLFNTK